MKTTPKYLSIYLLYLAKTWHCFIFLPGCVAGSVHYLLFQLLCDNYSIFFTRACRIFQLLSLSL